MVNKMKKDELIIDLKAMLLYVLRKWKLILIAMILFSVLLDIYSIKKIKDENNQEVFVSKDELVSIMSESEVSKVEACYAKYKTNDAIYQSYVDFTNTFLYLTQNGNQINKIAMQYEVTTSNGSANTKANEISNAFFDINTCEKITETLGVDVDWSEYLIGVETENIAEEVSVSTDMNSQQVLVFVYVPDTENTESIKKVVDDRVNDIINSYGLEGEVKYVGTANTVVSSAKYASSYYEDTKHVKSAKTVTDKVTQDLTDRELKLFNCLMQEADLSDDSSSINAAVKVEKTNIINIKYLIIGAFGGGFLSVMILILWYLFMPFVRCKSDVENGIGISVIEESEVPYLLKKDEPDKCVIISSLNDNDTQNVMKRLKENNKEIIAETVNWKNDLEFCDKLLEASNVLFVEKVYKSNYKNLLDEKEFVSRYDVKILGSILISK